MLALLGIELKCNNEPPALIGYALRADHGVECKRKAADEAAVAPEGQSGRAVRKSHEESDRDYVAVGGGKLCPELIFESLEFRTERLQGASFNGISSPL